MEVTHGKQLMQMSDETDAALLSNGENLIVLHMCRAGLVSNVSKECQKDSPVFILVGTIDGDFFLLLLK